MPAGVPRSTGVGPPALADWLAVSAGHLVEPLFSPGATERLARLAASLPGDALAALEVRLQGGGSADLSIRLTHPAQARRLARRVGPAHLAAFLDRWADAEGSLGRIPAVWLELDLDREPAGRPVPTVIAKLPPGADVEWITGELLPALRGRPLTPGQLRLLRRHHARIPPAARLLYVFSLLPRGGGGTVRMEIDGLTPAELAAHLDVLSPTAAARLAPILGHFAEMERLHLSFDLEEDGAAPHGTAHPRIGVEGSFRRLPRREPGWRRLLAGLVEAGLCEPARRDAVLAWPGWESFWTAPARWPLAATGPAGFCFRFLSHLKVVAEPGRPLAAKAYLLLGYLVEAPPGAAASSPASRSQRST